MEQGEATGLLRQGPRRRGGEARQGTGVRRIGVFHVEGAAECRGQRGCVGSSGNCRQIHYG